MPELGRGVGDAKRRQGPWLSLAQFIVRGSMTSTWGLSRRQKGRRFRRRRYQLELAPPPPERPPPEDDENPEPLEDDEAATLAW